MAVRNVRPKETQAVILSGAATSSQVNLRDGSFAYTSGNIVAPDLTSTNTFKYQVTADGTNWVDLTDHFGTATGYTAIPAPATYVLPSILFSFLAFRVVASGNQGADMTFVVRLV